MAFVSLPHLLRQTRWHLLLLALLLLAATGLRAQSVLYVMEQSPTGFKVAGYDLATGLPYLPNSTLSTSTFYVPSGHFSGIATDPVGNVYLAFDGNLYKYDNRGNPVTSFGTNGSTYTGYYNIVTSAAVNPAGTQLLVPFNAYTNQTIAFSTQTGAAIPGFTPSTQPNLGAVAFNPSGTSFYVTNKSGALGGSTIVQFGPNGGATGTNLTPMNSTTTGGGFQTPAGLLFTSDTSFLVVENNLGLLAKYNLVGTNATLDPGFGGGPGGGAGWTGNLNSLTGGIATDGAGNIYLVSSLSSNYSVTQLSSTGAVLNSNFITFGSGYTPTNIAVGLAAVPEPRTYLLYATGLGLAAFAARRRGARTPQDALSG